MVPKVQAVGRGLGHSHTRPDNRAHSPDGSEQLSFSPWSAADEAADTARFSMSELGQKAKYSPRVEVFRFAPKSGHCATESACPFRANFGSRQTQSITQFQELRSDFHAQYGHACHIAARAVQAGDKPDLHRIGDRGEDNRDRRRCRFCRTCRRRAHRCDHGHLLADQIG